MQPLILAAGKGTRMRSELPKTLFSIDGMPMLGHIIGTVCEVPELAQPIVVVGYGAEDVKEYLGNTYQYAHQVELNGTGSAVAAALPLLPKEGYVLVLYGDQPFIASETLEAIVALCAVHKPTFVQSTVVLPDFDGWRSVFNSYGRIVRDSDGRIHRMVEYKNATDEERAITEVNPGLIAVEARWLHEAIPLIQPNAVNGEYYLTDLLALAREQGKRIETVGLSATEALGINSPEDAEHALRVVSNTGVL